jgi:hypothetical protein
MGYELIIRVSSNDRQSLENLKDNIFPKIIVNDDETKYSNITNYSNWTDINNRQIFNEKSANLTGCIITELNQLT